MPARFLREISDEIIAAPLTIIFNHSLPAGVFPSEWKHSHITLLHKGRSPGDPGNFRPISVVPILAKILEKIVFEQLGDYLETNFLLHPHQGAYRCDRSTEDILLAAVDQIVHSLDAGNAVCVAFLDFRKVFDSIDHYVLLNRLFDLNLSPAVLCWFKNYLSHKLHCVKGTNTFSE